MRILYNLFIAVYTFLIRLASPFHTKAKLWIQGRQNLLEHLREDSQSGERTIWIHCASLGEFEQGRPVIEAIKERDPETRIVLTFFSPSGYEVRKNYPLADIITYLPMDTRKNASDFIEIVKPDIVLFVKYEYWFYYFNELKRRNIPLFMISAVFRPNQVFFKWYGKFHRDILKKVSLFFVQNSQSYELLRLTGIQENEIVISGDTRFDRVHEVAETSFSDPVIEHFCLNRNVFVAGSIWPEDETLLIRFIQQAGKQWRFIIATHETDEVNVKRLINMPGVRTIRYSKANESTIEEANVLIIDMIGKLSSLYRFGRYAYIGGGFGKGIHNILEAAAYGIPVFFGPNYDKFEEAKELIRKKGAYCVTKAEMLFKIISGLEENPEQYHNTCITAKQYILENRGATGIIAERVQEFIQRPQ